MEGILQSVRKTHRALVVHEDKVFGGFGGDRHPGGRPGLPLAGRSRGARGRRLRARGVQSVLERAVLPDAAGILAAALKVLNF